MCRHAELVLGRATALDADARTVAVSTEEAGDFEIGYDRLVVTLGAVTRTFPVPGLEHAHAFKDLADAIHLRNHVLRQLDAADAEVDPERAEQHLTFVFIGAGYAGVEAMAELADLADDALRFYPRLRSVRRRWVIADAAPKILPEIPLRLGDYAARELAGRGYELYVGTTLESYDGREAVLSNGVRLNTDTLVWTAGVRAHPLVHDFGLPLDDRGRVRVDELFRVEGHERIYALGDCAAVPNTRTPGRFDPPTCQHALRQARRLAKNLTGDVEPYGYRMLGQVATLGRYKGIAELPGLKLSGFPGWWVTRSYHLYQLPLLSRKLRVVADWTTSLAFRRDVVELSGLGHPHRLDG
jgi:NADH dehydrogenase